MKLSEIIKELANEINRRGDREVVKDDEIPCMARPVNEVHFRSIRAIDTNFVSYPAVVITLRRAK